MNLNKLKSLSMEKYERLLPRLFPGAVRYELHDRQGRVIWDQQMKDEAEGDEPGENEQHGNQRPPRHIGALR